MASFELEGFEDLATSLQRFAAIPEEELKRMVVNMAETALPKIKSNGEALGVRDPMSDVHILDKMKIGKFKKTLTGGYVDITFSGTRMRNETRTRNAEIAFVNEYGKRSQRARPFIGLALTENEDEILAQADEAFGDWADDVFTD